jgi:hypothetical protein
VEFKHTVAGRKTWCGTVYSGTVYLRKGGTLNATVLAYIADALRPVALLCRRALPGLVGVEEDSTLGTAGPAVQVAAAGGAAIGTGASAVFIAIGLVDGVTHISTTGAADWRLAG